MGAQQAHKIAQRAIWSHTLNRDLLDDGILGDKTFYLLNKWGIVLLSSIRSEQAGFYRLLAAIDPNQQDNLQGLLNRAYLS
jgi:hypothetical protein